MNHKELNVWNESLSLVSDIYILLKDFPAEEKFGLVLQIKRSCISIPSNIAEGCGRKGEKELIRFLYISLGSLAELETQIIISQRLNFIKKEENIAIIFDKIIYIRRMLSNLIKSLEVKII